MKPLHINTPLIKSAPLSKKLNANVWLKMDALQPSGSFKNRGVGYACQQHHAKGVKQLVSSSGGNAGLAVAYCGGQLGMKVTVVVPKTTKQRAIDLIELEGAKVIVHGENWPEAHQKAMSLTGDDAALIHPFDDPALWQGHASIIDEVCQAGVKPDAVVLSVGGGGLLCGVAQGLEQNGLDDVPIVAVETIGAQSLYAAKQAAKHVEIDGISSIATSLGATKVAKRAYDLLSERNIACEVVPDSAAVKACIDFIDDHRIVVEPACGAALSVVYNEADGLPQVLKAKQNILVIVCGGVGMSLAQLQLC